LLFFGSVFTIDKLVKSRKGPFFVIPANPGSGPGQAPESSIFKELQESWTPFFNGVTTFCETINCCHPQKAHRLYKERGYAKLLRPSSA
jgi:hypothetical protein